MAGRDSFCCTTLNTYILKSYGEHRKVGQRVKYFSFLSDKATVLEAGHLSLINAEDKEAWNSTATPPHAFISWCLIKQKDNFSYVCLTPASVGSECLALAPDGEDDNGVAARNDEGRDQE